MLGTLAGRNPLVVSLATLPREGSVRTATIVTAIQATTIRNRKRTLATPIRAKIRFMASSRGTAIGRGQKGRFAPAANRPPLRRGRLRGASHRQRYRRRPAPPTLVWPPRVTCRLVLPHQIEAAFDREAGL